MLLSPFAVVADAYVACEVRAATMCDRDSQGLCALCGGNDTSVAVGLFDEMLVNVYPHLIIPVQFLVPLHRSEIGGGEETGEHGRCWLLAFRYSLLLRTANCKPRIANSEKRIANRFI